MSSPLVFSGVGLTDPTNSFKILVKNEAAITGKKRNGFCFTQQLQGEDDDAAQTSESSSIGLDDDDDDDEEEVQSKGFSSLESIEQSLPIKRGLSNFFSGKSKSFANLSASASAGAADLAKSENPLNKRRRILMASKARRASYSSFVSTYLPPLLSPDNTVVEEGDDEEDDEKESGEISPLSSGPIIKDGIALIDKRAFGAPRSFSLTDFQHV